MPNPLLRFVHLTDTHFSPTDYRHTDARYNPRLGTRALIQHVNQLAHPPAFILHTGDVAYDPFTEIYDEIATTFAEFKAPLVYLPGNHDHSLALQEKIIGEPEPRTPYYREIEREGVRFILLDSNGPQSQPPAGHVDDEQIEWLRERLAQDDPRPIVVAVHHALAKTGTSEWYDRFMMTINGEAVHEVLRTAADRIRVVLHGHVHMAMTMTVDGLLYATTPSSWRQFRVVPEQGMETVLDDQADPGYSIVTVTTHGAFIQYVRYRVGALDDAKD